MRQSTLGNRQLCLVGHPYAPIGMGEHLRASFRSFRAVHVSAGLLDVFELEQPDDGSIAEFAKAQQRDHAEINIFHINGNEVEQIWNHLNYSKKWSGYNIIYPLWELARYPSEWAQLLDRFDEIWAPSKFIFDALKKACEKPVYHMPLACEIALTDFKSRRHFGLPEEDYIFLFFFDLRSYSSRKNPEAVIEAFRRFLTRRPYTRSHLVVKVNGVHTNPALLTKLREAIADLDSNVTLIHAVLSSNDVKNLVRCCDAFISLHRAEGFGFGIAEAMVLGKPVIATSYSGNMDFMNEEVALCVDYSLVPVKDGEYPHYEDQVWAEPDVQQAAIYMTNLVDNPGLGREIGLRATRHMRNNFSYRRTGLHYLRRLDYIKDHILCKNVA